jgi:predicted flavoprotein YhiN
MSEYDAIVLGAGAAGLFCAATAGQRGKRVLLLDHAAEPGKKIVISGGGRCNFTNLHTAPDRYIASNPHFAKSALSRYTPADFIALIESYAIAWHEKTLGQLFCDGSARQVVAMLLGDAHLRAGDRLGGACRGAVPGGLRGAGRHRPGAGDRDRRALDPQDGRDRVRL